MEVEWRRIWNSQQSWCCGSVLLLGCPVMHWRSRELENQALLQVSIPSLAQLMIPGGGFTNSPEPPGSVSFCVSCKCSRMVCASKQSGRNGSSCRVWCERLHAPPWVAPLVGLHLPHQNLRFLLASLPASGERWEAGSSPGCHNFHGQPQSLRASDSPVLHA